MAVIGPPQNNVVVPENLKKIYTFYLVPLKNHQMPISFIISVFDCTFRLGLRIFFVVNKPAAT
jgi:hypothetical protein